jgi:hypothetical protein
MTAFITIDLSYVRGAECVGCGVYGDHRHTVSVDDCGEPTAMETGVGRIACQTCHDRTYPETPAE